MKIRNLGYGILTASLVLAAAGCCEGGKNAMQGPCDLQFGETGPANPVNQACDTQAASGNRADAMLGTRHFCGDKLNSLGAAKLDSMLRDDDMCKPMSVYLDVPADDFSKPRHDAVAAYLKAHGLAETQIALKEGPNPNAKTPSAMNMNRYYKTEGGVPTGAAADVQLQQTSITGMGGTK
jgi:hypothetical protein